MCASSRINQYKAQISTRWFTIYTPNNQPKRKREREREHFACNDPFTKLVASEFSLSLCILSTEVGKMKKNKVQRETEREGIDSTKNAAGALSVESFVVGIKRERNSEMREREVEREKEREREKYDIGRFV